MPDVIPNHLLVQTNSADAVPSRPETPPEQRSLRFQKFTMDSGCAFTLQVPHRHRNAVLRWDAQQHVNMVRHGLPFHKFHPPVSAQLTKNSANSTPNSSVKCLLAILRQDDNMILALPFHVCLTLPILHDGPPCPSGHSSQEDRLASHSGNGIAFSILTGVAGGLLSI